MLRKFKKGGRPKGDRHLRNQKRKFEDDKMSVMVMRDYLGRHRDINEGGLER